MKRAIIIGSGISGMAAAVKLAEAGLHVLLVSPFPSERSQSVMAAGGINAVLADHEEGDSVACHIEDTLRSGNHLAGKQAVTGLCERAEEIVRYLEKLGTVFTVDENGRPARRAFGGQSFRRTCYCGSSTGKQIVSALIMEVRRFEAAGLIRRLLRTRFHSALVRDGVCYGVLLFDETTGGLVAETADAVVMASGGQNALFGKTTGSTQCDGYAAGKLFLQGAELKNLEFIQYHPTTLETAQKRMLITEAARGEGGRLFYEENGKRVYFMEDRFGPNGNLMTRDVVSREIDRVGRDVFLDVSFLGRAEIEKRIPEVRELCLKYGNFDVSETPIPVAPSVHFFMGGLAVRLNHETTIRNLFAVGECASMYHGANRLGGNSLLAAVYSAWVAAETIVGREAVFGVPDFSDRIREEEQALRRMTEGNSTFPVMYIRDEAAKVMRRNLGIVRNGETIAKGIADIDYYLSVSDRLRYDTSVTSYEVYSLRAILSLAKATLVSAAERRESRGAHFREDYPETAEAFAYSTLISCDEGQFRVRLDREHAYES